VQLSGGTWDPAYVYRFVDVESSLPISSAMVTGFPTPRATRRTSPETIQFTVRFGEMGRDS
jgi:hypothetical protein